MTSFRAGTTSMTVRRLKPLARRPAPHAGHTWGPGTRWVRVISGLGRAATASMARFGPAFFLLVVLQVLGLTASLTKGLRSRRGFSGVAFLIAETVFEPGIFFFEAINLLLLAQAVATVMKAVQAQAGLGRAGRWARSKAGPRAKRSCSRRRPFWSP